MHAHPRALTLYCPTCTACTAESGYKPRGAREPDTATWTPFRPVKAMAVDLFPHTQHVECVVLLERS